VDQALSTADRLDRLFDAAGCTGALHVSRLSNGAEVALRADEVWLAASVIKVAIGFELYAHAAEGNLDPTRMITLGPEQRTPGPTGISVAQDPVTMSLRDLCGAMLAVSDNAATDAVLDAVGLPAVNDRLAALGCTSTVLVESIGASIDAMAVDLGFDDYATLLRAQAGELGAEAQKASTDQARISAARVLDPARATRTTARDMTRFLAAVWEDRAAPPAACADLRRAMAAQVSRRLAPAVPDGGGLAAKTGSLFGRVRNEVGVITAPGGERYAVAVLTRPHEPFVGTATIDDVMAEAVRIAITSL
jgi:beta-lactamase class A